MEFRFDVQKVFHCNSQGIYLLLPQSNLRTKEICEVIDVMGRESSRSQGLKSIITTAVRFFSSSDNKIYLKIEGQKVVGILKTGIRKLFYTNEIGKIVEMSPLCLLDFYVHESFQRSGYGKELYEYMLIEENVTPNKIAIDRPSSKLIGFMRKHYNLNEYIPQNNNYVIFRQFFTHWSTPIPKSHTEESKSIIHPPPNHQDQPVYLNDNIRDSHNKSSDLTLLYKQERQISRGETQYERLSPYNQERSKLRADTYNDRVSPNTKNRIIETAEPRYERKVGLANAERVIEKYGLREDHGKQNYESRPPWAIQAKFSQPTTTSSQYGSYAYRK
ncbi:hypothetical protein SteCoe_22416 [Stentor coeruleus]|uniref:Alpha-tubulin N-acetyltransferase n=1 Tax=Stentor coeruleus TaxID=5963 RepID=A0A1R2BMB3_9CILI|nr:hypothetical protein SteCoe_22416 [Stentor coeruleus]